MNETLLTWVVFILSFGGMVVIHELGHFLAARAVKVEVEEFAIGLPTPGAITYWISKGYFLLRNGRRVEIPRNFRMPVFWNDLAGSEVMITVDQVDDRLILRSIEAELHEESKRPVSRSNRLDGIHVNAIGLPVESHGNTRLSKRLVKAGKTTGAISFTDVIEEAHPGTRFTIYWLPLGGFVRPKGENDPNVKGGLAAAAPWKRLFVLFAGPVMNLLAAVVLISVIITQMGGIITSTVDQSTGEQEILITEVVRNSPAEGAGLQVGDVILKAGGVQLKDTEEASNLIKANPEKPIQFEVLRGGETLVISITPRMNERMGRPLIGVSMCGGCEFKPVTGFFETVQYGVRITGQQIYLLATLPVRLIQGSLPAEQSRLIGLKGIFDIMGQSVANDVEASRTQSTSAESSPYNQPVNTLSLLVSLTISLGIFNLFPFPALDGGRIIFVLPELILRRRVPHEFENIVHGIGMMLLLAVMLYVNFRDFVDPITNQFP